MKKTLLVLIVIALTLTTLILGYQRFRENTSDVRMFTYDGNPLALWVADSALEQKNGLSRVKLSKLETAGVEGMIFLFNEQKERTFWMNDMEFDLDVIWLQNGKIVKIDRNVQAPNEGDETARMYSRPFAIDAVIEVPAGMAEDLGFQHGMSLQDLVSETKE